LCERDRRILRNFRPQGEDSFLGLLRIISASVANDYFRRMSSAKRGGKVVTFALDGELQEAGAVPCPAAGQIQRSALLNELDRKLRSAKTIGERDRSIFWLYYLHGFSAEEIARLPDAGLTAKGVESLLRRVTLWLRAQVGETKPRQADGTGKEGEIGSQKGFSPANPIDRVQEQ
jgi:RNA polymerase sigma-70 factor (ECF subfamily)